MDPLGKPFFSKGVDNINPWGDTAKDGSKLYSNAIAKKYHPTKTIQNLNLTSRDMDQILLLGL